MTLADRDETTPDKRSTLTKGLRAIERGVSRVPPDLFWYGLSLLGTSAGTVLQFVANDDDARIIGVLCLVFGLLFAGGRLLLGRLARLERALGSHPVALGHDRDLSPLALRLVKEKTEGYQRDLDSITRSGIVSTEDQHEILTLLKLMSQEASDEMLAIDFIDLAHWFKNPELFEYLTTQLARAADGVDVKRLRFVTEAQLEDPEERAMLREFIRLHDEAGAELRLCTFERGKQLEVMFFPKKGTLLVDPQSRPCYLSGQFGDAGYIESAQVFLRRTDGVERCRKDWRRLWQEAGKGGADRRVRDRLNQHRDDPPFFARAASA